MSWSVSAVVKRLDELDLGQYASQFEKNDISGPVLPLLTDAHLKELGIKVIGHRLKFLKYVQSLMKGGSGGSSSASNRSSNSRQPQSRQKAQQPPPEPEGSSEDEPPPTTNGGTSSNGNGGAASSWEQKRRQMMLKKMQANKQSNGQNDGSQSNRSNGRLLSPEIIEEVPKVQKQQAEVSRPKPKSKPPPPPSYDDEDDNDDDVYTPPPPPKKPVRKQNPTPPPPAEDDGDDDRVECAYCHRKFASDRIEKHEQICSRMSSKKKRVFDASKQRLQGTEAAQFASKSKNKEEPKPKPSKFKQEHEKLVEALRAARKIQAYEKAKEEGKAVGPPPELPKYEIEDDDRVPCPYCGRKFGADAAQKHISVCERMNGGRNRGAANKRGGRR